MATNGVRMTAVTSSNLETAIAALLPDLLPGRHSKVNCATGFWVSVENPKSRVQQAHLVTVRHFLEDDGHIRSKVLLRVNRKSGGHSTGPIDLFTSGAGRNLFLHPDPAVDLAVILVAVAREGIDWTALPASALCSQSDLEDAGGARVSFLGLPGPHTTARNVPRGGEGEFVAPPRPVLWNGSVMDLLLVRASPEPGHSGSPVLRTSDSSLVGVMKGKVTAPASSKDASSPATIANQAVVVPAYRLHEILFGEELRTARGF